MSNISNIEEEVPRLHNHMKFITNTNLELLNPEHDLMIQAGNKCLSNRREVAYHYFLVNTPAKLKNITDIIQLLNKEIKKLLIF